MPSGLNPFNLTAFNGAPQVGSASGRRNAELKSWVNCFRALWELVLRGGDSGRYTRNHAVGKAQAAARQRICILRIGIDAPVYACAVNVGATGVITLCTNPPRGVRL